MTAVVCQTRINQAISQVIKDNIRGDRSFKIAVDYLVYNISDQLLMDHSSGGDSEGITMFCVRQL